MVSQHHELVLEEVILNGEQFLLAHLLFFKKLVGILNTLRFLEKYFNSKQHLNHFELNLKVIKKS